jgi:facilitated trehalose transporter
MVTIGVLLAIVVGAANSWRWLTIACLASVVVWSLLLLAVPESPVHQLANRQYREARHTLEWLRSTIHVDGEFEDIQRGLDESQAGGGGGGLTDLLKRQNLVPLVISLYLMLGQQLSGMNAVIFYVVDIFEAAGSSLGSTVESVIVAVVQVVATILAALVMDKLGKLNLTSFLFYFLLPTNSENLCDSGSFYWIRTGNRK